jgi:catecholate siderophore receptor
MIKSKQDRKRKKDKKNRNKSQRGPTYWVAVSAMGSLVAYSAFDAKTISFAFPDQTVDAVSVSVAGAQSSPAHRFDIPPGLLDAVLGTFETVTGFRVTLNPEIGRIQSPGVSGVFTVEQALKQILAGTRVSYRFTGPQVIALEVSGPADTVDVTAGLPSIIASPKFSEPLLDTPQSVTVVTRQVMEDQGATTLRDGLRNVAGISLAAGEGGAQGDNLTIRGFTARNDIFLDGMRDFGSYYRDPFNLEEVDVVQGPSASTFGSGSTGGVVNQATKMPNLLRAFSGTFDGGTDGTRRATADVNVPIPAFGKGGDSGSLVVAKAEAKAVGLYFAGPDSGEYGVANHIQDVLHDLEIELIT